MMLCEGRAGAEPRADYSRSRLVFWYFYTIFGFYAFCDFLFFFFIFWFLVIFLYFSENTTTGARSGGARTNRTDRGGAPDRGSSRRLYLDPLGREIANRFGSMEMDWSYVRALATAHRVHGSASLSGRRIPIALPTISRKSARIPLTLLLIPAKSGQVTRALSRGRNQLALFRAWRWMWRVCKVGVW